MAGSKLYKFKFTKEDILLLQNYISLNAKNIFIEVWQNGSEDGDVYEIHPTNLLSAIHLTDKYYDNINADKKVAELLIQDRSGDIVPIYHTTKNRSGITYEALGYAKKCVR